MHATTWRPLSCSCPAARHAHRRPSAQLGAMAYYSFSLPHSSMTATVTLQSPVQRQRLQHQRRPVCVRYQLRVIPDDALQLTLSAPPTRSYGIDTVTIGAYGWNSLCVLIQPHLLRGTVFGQRAGYYTLLVTATDTGRPRSGLPHQRRARVNDSAPLSSVRLLPVQHRQGQQRH